MKTYLIRGVPLVLQQDGWWLSGAVPRRDQPVTRRRTDAPGIRRATLLAALIALGDVLVWQAVPGVSLAVFGALVVMAALCATGRRLSLRQTATFTAATMLCLMPLVELVQPLSVLIAAAGLSAVLAAIAGIPLGQVPRAALRLWPVGTVQTVRDAGAVWQTPQSAGLPDLIRQQVLSWFLPLGLGLVFVLLLLAANPVAEAWTRGLGDAHVALPAGERVLFWALLVPVIWTALRLSHLGERLLAPRRPARMGPHAQGMINPSSVTRALVLFNAVFALQTGMDAAYLHGGVRLPDGISHAEYAHRGAYPLLLTALLAGGFALLTRRWVAHDRRLRALLMLWVAQNVALMLSAMVRLDLYVGVYGLTHLRLAAAIWMGLVAAGLALILWQVWRQHGNGWLVLRGGALAAATLYLCSLFSFDAAIAHYNLSHPVVRDDYYLSRLGDAAKPVILRHDRALGRPICRGACGIAAPRDWREWGFRNWRARNSLARIQTEAAL